MSEIADHFPIELAARPLRFDSRETDPAKLVRNQLAEIFRTHQGNIDSILAVVAKANFHLARFKSELEQTDHTGAKSVADGLDILESDLTEMLEQHGVETVDLTGQPWNKELTAQVDLRGYQTREDLQEPQVAHMELPVIRRGGRLISKGAALVDAPKRE